jgi:hypothetical protein
LEGEEEVRAIVVAPEHESEEEELKNGSWRMGSSKK